jgi:hypothetical protein
VEKRNSARAVKTTLHTKEIEVVDDTISVKDTIQYIVP